MIKSVIFLIFSATILALGGLFVQVNNLNPYSLSNFDKTLFFVTLTIALCGSLSLLFSRFSPNLTLKLLFTYLRVSFIISITIVLLLYLNTLHLLSLFSVLPICIGAFLLELFLRGGRKNA